MNESVKLIIEKLETLAPQAQEMFGRMMEIYIYQVYAKTIVLALLLIVSLTVVVKTYDKRVDYESPLAGALFVAGIACSIAFAISGIIVLISVIIPLLTDPQATYIMQLMR